MSSPRSSAAAAAAAGGDGATPPPLPPSPPPPPGAAGADRAAAGECPALWRLLQERLGLDRDVAAVAVPAAGAAGRCKNLLAKDKAGRLFLVVAPEAAAVRFPVLRRELGAKRSLSMVPAAAVPAVLGGAAPGAVSPLSLCRPGAKAAEVTVVPHPALSAAGPLLWHVDAAETAVWLPLPQVLELCRGAGAAVAEVAAFA